MRDATLRIATAVDRPVLERLWQLYRHDLSEFRDSLPDARGLFKTHELPDFLGSRADPDRAAYLVEVGPAPAGFALVGGAVSGSASMSAFFLVRRVRGAGVGQRVARQILDSHPGGWEIAFQEANGRAARFWRSVCAAVDPHVREERRDVPHRPDLPPDVFLVFDVPARGDGSERADGLGDRAAAGDELQRRAD